MTHFSNFITWWKWQGLPNERKVGSNSPIDWVAILDTYANTLESPPSHLKEGNNNIKPCFSISCQLLSIFLAYLTRIDSENSAKHHSLQKTSDFSLMGSGISSGFTHNWHSPTHTSCKYWLTCVLAVTSLWRPGMQRPCLSLFTTSTVVPGTRELSVSVYGLNAESHPQQRKPHRDKSGRR